MINLRFHRLCGMLWKQVNSDWKLIGMGYAGHGKGINNPNMQSVANEGPLPAGNYTLRLSDISSLGPIVFFLQPDKENDMLGRGDFYIHWDNRRADFSASEGCIVLLTTNTFCQINNGDRLEVV